MDLGSAEFRLPLVQGAVVSVGNPMVRQATAKAVACSKRERAFAQGYGPGQVRRLAVLECQELGP
jgi:hypothetical protein